MQFPEVSPVNTAQRTRLPTHEVCSFLPCWPSAFAPPVLASLLSSLWAQPRPRKKRCPGDYNLPAGGGTGAISTLGPSYIRTLKLRATGSKHFARSSHSFLHAFLSFPGEDISMERVRTHIINFLCIFSAAKALGTHRSSVYSDVVN